MTPMLSSCLQGKLECNKGDAYEGRSGDCSGSCNGDCLRRCIEDCSGGRSVDCLRCRSQDCSDRVQTFTYRVVE